jgi:hypothetical protein
MKVLRTVIFFLLASFAPGQILAQYSSSEIANMIQAYKLDQRGPYKDIRWFCQDGTVIPPKEKCPLPGGVQRARYKDEVVKLGVNNHIFLGQILSNTPTSDFLDTPNDHSRLKQYILENYLYNIDDGWVQKKSQYYRGAIQVEDEEEWGRKFLLEWLSDKLWNNERLFLAREAVKIIPHGKQENTLLTIRSLSKTIADRTASFMDIRTKIHGNPQVGDIELTRKYLEKNQDKLTSLDKKELNDLIKSMETFYGQGWRTKAFQLYKELPQSTKAQINLEAFAERLNNTVDVEQNVIAGIDILSSLKDIIQSTVSASTRLNLIDLSIIIERKIISDLGEWSDQSLGGTINKACYLTQMASATGYLFDWELEELQSLITSIPRESITFNRAFEINKALKRSITWGSAMIQTEFGDELTTFSTFEPKVNGFIDDRIRSSALLYLGQSVSTINDFLVTEAGWKNTIFDQKSSSVQGLNPGFSKGKMIVLERLEDEKIDPQAIYVLRYSPSDLEPVAGILSISEGNVVSHLQLLARNLGIPNAAITDDLFNTLKSYNGRDVFYAVSNRGGVIIKSADEMNTAEKDLFKKITVNEEVVSVPIDKLELKDTHIIDLKNVDASDSGLSCGPKAANLGQLKKLFPDKVVEGFVIPFSIFKDHMLQAIPGETYSYWDHLTETFNQIKAYKTEGMSSENIEGYTLKRLETLRTAIKSMPLKKEFVQELEDSFKSILNCSLGECPVFLRSDTNMEDLKDFTGAGLNLTIFNTIEKTKILQGIKDVWASPYTDRSYKWRQKFLTNPEDVYPSILVIPSVFVDYSGVIITKDFVDGTQNGINCAFNQGAGGAVDGQKSESWILYNDGRKVLISPARDRKFKKLSMQGGTVTDKSMLSAKLLNPDNIKDIWKVLQTVHLEMPKNEMQPPYDIELGFQNNKLWLFQIRPFVENKKALSTSYLNELDPEMPEDLNFKLSTIINNQ